MTWIIGEGDISKSGKEKQKERVKIEPETALTGAITAAKPLSATLWSVREQATVESKKNG